jgi:hypothetical protein
MLLYIIFLNFVSWFPDTVRNWPACKFEPILTLVVRNYHQETNPDDQPSGKSDRSCRVVPVGSFLTAGRQEYVS